MNPYEANPLKIPASDPYVNEPFFGRYYPQPNDLKPDQKHINSTSPESLEYWASVLKRCDSSTILFDNPWGGRDVFAVGSLIIKSSHRKNSVVRDYSKSDANELAATALARPALHNLGVKVPEVYFAGKINGSATLVQERIPGVGLNVAWTYLSQDQKLTFKQQARQILEQLDQIKAPTSQTGRSYVTPDPNPIQNHGIQELEKSIIFAENNYDSDLGFMHNDCQPSNLIVNNDKIVGLIDWEMAGFFGWNTAREVHLKIRMPKENFANAGITKDQLDDILFWNDLYENTTVHGGGYIEHGDVSQRKL